MGLISYELDLLSCRDDSRAETVFHHVAPKAFPGDVYLPPSSGPIPPYFWGATFSAEKAWASLPRHSGLAEARALVGDGGFETLEGVITEALEIITRMYETIDDEADAKTEALVPLWLSDDLQRWVAEQQARGRVLPAKGYGLQRANEGVIQSLGAVRWPDPLLTNNTLFGPGFANLLIGAHDARSLYSNYCCDTGFYYEHGFHKVFSQFEPLLRQARDDAHSLQTPGGVERRRAADLCLRYVLGKVALEERHVARLSGKSARFGRRAAQVVCFAESSLLGMAAEAMARGFDPAAVWADMVFSSPATDVVDVGSDLGNSEVLNSLLNTADLAGPAAGGVVTEPALRRVYDAYACVCARLFTHRWEEPTARMCGQLYVWHLKDDRHLLLRRALLGWPKARRPTKPPPQREADFDEAFDEHYHTTGFSRPLTTACDGDEPCCNQAMRFVQQRADEPLLPRLWDDLVTRPLAYVAGGAVDARRERALCDALGDTQARMYAKGLVAEMAWMTCHASQHAWQVNYLMEAAMFGSLLDDGALRGKLDRADG